MEKEKYKTKSGKESERYIIATLDDEGKQLLANGGFLAYVHQGSGKVYAVKMQAGRKLSSEEKAKRLKEKKEKTAKFYKRRLDSMNRKITDAEAFLNKLANVDVTAFPVLARQKAAAVKKLASTKSKIVKWEQKASA